MNSPSLPLSLGHFVYISSLVAGEILLHHEHHPTRTHIPRGGGRRHILLTVLSLVFWLAALIALLAPAPLATLLREDRPRFGSASLDLTPDLRPLLPIGAILLTIAWLVLVKSFLAYDAAPRGALRLFGLWRDDETRQGTRETRRDARMHRNESRRETEGPLDGAGRRRLVPLASRVHPRATPPPPPSVGSAHKRTVSEGGIFLLPRGGKPMMTRSDDASLHPTASSSASPLLSLTHHPATARHFRRASITAVVLGSLVTLIGVLLLLTVVHLSSLPEPAPLHDLHLHDATSPPSAPLTRPSLMVLAIVHVLALISLILGIHTTHGLGGWLRSRAMHLPTDVGGMTRRSPHLEERVGGEGEEMMIPPPSCPPRPPPPPPSPPPLSASAPFPSLPPLVRSASVPLVHRATLLSPPLLPPSSTSSSSATTSSPQSSSSHVWREWRYFQPFRGGGVFIVTQALGWALFAMALSLSLALLKCQVSKAWLFHFCPHQAWEGAVSCVQGVAWIVAGAFASAQALIVVSLWAYGGGAGKAAGGGGGGGGGGDLSSSLLAPPLVASPPPSSSLLSSGRVFSSCTSIATTTLLSLLQTWYYRLSLPSSSVRPLPPPSSSSSSLPLASLLHRASDRFHATLLLILLYLPVHLFLAIFLIPIMLLPSWKWVLTCHLSWMVPYALSTGWLVTLSSERDPYHTGSRAWPWMQDWARRYLPIMGEMYLGGVRVIRDGWEDKLGTTKEEEEEETRGRGEGSASEQEGGDAVAPSSSSPHLHCHDSGHSHNSHNHPAPPPPHTKKIFAYAPHGLFPIGAGFYSLLPDFSRLFPSIPRPVPLTADAMYLCPILRDVMAWAGARRVARATLLRALEEHGSVTLVPGGQQELVLAARAHVAPPSSSSGRRHQIALATRHKGFIRIAIEHKAAIYPVLCFNEIHQLRNLVHFPRMQECTYKVFGFPIPYLVAGRWGLPWPRKIASGVTFVIGEPIWCDPEQNPPPRRREEEEQEEEGHARSAAASSSSLQGAHSQHQGDKAHDALVEYYHAEFYKQMQALWDKYHSKFGNAHLDLSFHDQ